MKNVKFSRLLKCTKYFKINLFVKSLESQSFICKQNLGSIHKVKLVVFKFVHKPFCKINVLPRNDFDPR